MADANRGPASGPHADYRPVGTCPKPWVACIGDVTLRDGRGVVKRFASMAAALKSARRAALELR